VGAAEKDIAQKGNVQLWRACVLHHRGAAVPPQTQSGYLSETAMDKLLAALKRNGTVTGIGWSD
jgi:hypothetical protein